MSRLMSVAFTEQAVRDRTKTVTRRKGWWTNSHARDHLTLCRKVMGRKAGEPLVRICDVEVVNVNREVLDTITADEVAREGFPEMSPEEFVQRFFVDAQGIDPSTVVTRIEWRYLDERCNECSRPVPEDDAGPSCGAHVLHIECGPYFGCAHCYQIRSEIP